MHHDHRSSRLALTLALALAAVACGGTTSDSAGDGSTIATAREPLDQLVGSISQRGMLVKLWKIDGPAGITPSRVVTVAACSKKTLYAVEKRQYNTPVGVLSLYVPLYSKTYGITWSRVKNADTGLDVTLDGPELACDHGVVLALNADGSAKWVKTLSDGNFAEGFKPIDQSVQVARIQGGDGTFYGVTAAGEIYVASTRSIPQEPKWEGPLATVTSVAVTGTGTQMTDTDTVVGNTLAWPRRAYGLEAFGTVFFNDTLLEGQNSWVPLETSNERYLSLSVGDPNTLYAVQRRGTENEINKITTEELDCRDGIDNDANGFIDTEDPACEQPRADEFCAQKPDGNYCSSRYQPTHFLDQTNQQTALVRCLDGTATVQHGYCALVSPGNDQLKTEDSLVITDPNGYERWCNVHDEAGGWDFNYGGGIGTNPCGLMSGTVVRAGLYSKAGENQVVVNCDDKKVVKRGRGEEPLQAAYDEAVKGTNHCMFMVAPLALPIFTRMFDPQRGSKPFLHYNDTLALPLDQFGGEAGTSATKIDRFGLSSNGYEMAYDHGLVEGSPVYAVADGIVIDARETDVSGEHRSGSTFQHDLHIQYKVGLHWLYRETFVLYYAHLRKRLVANGQSVRAGQIVGYVGTTGVTGGAAHLHSALFRLSNINAFKTSNYAYGHHLAWSAGLPFIYYSAAVDVLGWGAPIGDDPWAHTYVRSTTNKPDVFGKGALSIGMFKLGEAFPYVPPVDP